MDLIQLVYLSSARQPFCRDELDKLVERADTTNRRAGVTGLLVYHDRSFIQVLEGEEAVVSELMEKISADPRHSGVLEVTRRAIDEREFDEWGMGRASMGRLEMLESKVVTEGARAGAERTGQRAHKLLRSFVRNAR